MKLSTVVAPSIIIIWSAAATLSAVAVAAAAEIDHAPFADGLTTELYSTNDDNDCTSSLGVSMALSLVYPSAVADAEEQLRTVLGFPTPTEQQSQQLVWSDTSTSLTDRYQGRCTFDSGADGGGCNLYEPTLEIANTVWVYDQMITLNASYAALVGELVQSLDFQSPDAGRTINHWVNASTNGLIDAMVDDGPLPPDWILVAMNSIYLKGSWANQFNEDRTNTDAFYSSPARTTATLDAVHFMNQVEYFPYSHDLVPGFQLVQLPLAGGAESNGLSMVLALPLTTTSSGGVEEDAPTRTASSVEVLAALPNLVRTQVALAVPKFRFESKYEDDLKAALQAMGMTAHFEGGSPEVLCIADGRCDAYIDVIIQKTIIDMNEKGVEAAAVTLVGIALTSMPPAGAILFQADHPFQFFLYDAVEDLVLFEGRVGAPDIPEGSLAPLEASHDDADFWSATFGKDVTAPPEFEVAVTTSSPPPTTPTTEDPTIPDKTSNPEMITTEDPIPEEMTTDPEMILTQDPFPAAETETPFPEMIITDDPTMVKTIAPTTEGPTSAEITSPETTTPETTTPPETTSAPASNTEASSTEAISAAAGCRSLGLLLAVMPFVGSLLLAIHT